MLSVHIEKEFRTAGKPSFQLKISEEFLPGFTVLFGPSGAGKSTLLDCIAGLLKPDKGIIKFGENVFFETAGRFSLPPHLSVENNVAYGLSGVQAAERTARMRTILDIFHAQRLLGRKPGELSGGEKQRVALARSVITNPHVLLLDEPLTGLDAGLRQSILEDLRSWNAEHRIPILYVTHNREELDAIGDRVVGIVDGRVQARGMPQEVLDAPRAVELAQAAGFENLLVGRVLEHRVEDGVMRVALDGNDCELEVPLGPQKPGDVVQVAIRAGDILLATQIPFGLSARNVLPGTVESIKTRGTIVTLLVNTGVRFVAHVTPGAMRSLELEAGSVVWLVLKTHSCHVVTPR
jgi:molybdate transport system ATP-binding protein